MTSQNPNKIPPVDPFPPALPGKKPGPNDVHKPLFISWMKEEDRPHNHGLDICLLVGGAGSSKCLGYNVPVLCFDGTIKPAQNIEVGDWLMGPDSTPRMVVETSRGRDVMYQINPVKGDSFTCNIDHILCLKKSDSKERYPGIDTINVELKEWLTWSKRKQKTFKLYRSEAIDFGNNPDLPINPYLFGLWLGDGCKQQMRITTGDEEILQYLKSTGCLTSSHKDHGNCSTHILSGFRGKLVSLGVLGNKHIPQIYLTASIEQRLQLLAGLVDSDGTLGTRGVSLIIVQKLKVLADQIAFLCRSLGFSAYTAHRETTWAYQGENKVGEAYSVSISGDYSRIPTLLPRKQGKPRKQIKNPLVTGFSVEELPESNYYGVTLEGPDRRFLLGDFTVTHNTCHAIACTTSHVAGTPNLKAVVGGKNFPLIKRNVFTEYAQRFSCRGGNWDHLLITKRPTANEMVARTSIGSQLSFLNLDKYDVARGFDADVVHIEEVNLMKAGSFEEMIRRSRGHMGKPRQFILTMNPTGDRDWIYYKFNMKQFEPDYKGPPLPIGKPCNCQLCQDCVNKDKVEREWVGGVKKYHSKTGKLYHWSGAKCSHCGAVKEDGCPGNQYYYRVIRSRSYDNPHNPASYVSDMRRDMSEEDARLFIEGEIVQVRTGKVYKSFGSHNVLDEDIPLNYQKDMIWTHDFNQDPMCSVIWQETDFGVHVVDEIIEWDANEEKVAKAFVKKFQGFKGVIYLYGDPAGTYGANRSESRRTSYQIIQDYLEKQGFTVRFMMEPVPGETKIPIKERINTLNAMLKNADGEVRIQINPQCQGLINSLASIPWDKNGKEEDKTFDENAKTVPTRYENPPIMSHPSCAFGYGVFKRHSILRDRDGIHVVVSGTKTTIKTEDKVEVIERKEVSLTKVESKADAELPTISGIAGLTRRNLSEREALEKKEREEYEDRFRRNMKKYLMD